MPLADRAISVTGLIGSIASFGDRALPFAEAAAPFLGHYGIALLAGIKIAQPIIRQIALAAPTVKSTIESGRPIFDAIEAHGPEVMVNIKKLYAIAVNHDPDMPQTDMTAAEVGDDVALSFAGPALFGRRWTAAEEARWFDQATGDTGAIHH